MARDLDLPLGGVLGYVLFPKSKFTKPKAEAWLKRRSFEAQLTETTHFWRAVLTEPPQEAEVEIRALGNHVIGILFFPKGVGRK